MEAFPEQVWHGVQRLMQLILPLSVPAPLPQTSHFPAAISVHCYWLGRETADRHWTSGRGEALLRNLLQGRVASDLGFSSSPNLDAVHTRAVGGVGSGPDCPTKTIVAVAV